MADRLYVFDDVVHAPGRLKTPFFLPTANTRHFSTAVRIRRNVPCSLPAGRSSTTNITN